MQTTVIREAVVRYEGPQRKASESMLTSADVVRFFSRLVPCNESKEHFLSVLLDAKHKPIAFQTVSVGTATASLVHPREVFQAAVGLGAVALIVAHNHPSGDPTPSREDREVAERLTQAGEVLGIKLLDFVVYAAAGHASLAEEGAL